MSERGWKWALRIMGWAFIIVPLVLAFSANNWDVKSAVLPSNQELNAISNQVTSIIGEGTSANPPAFDNPVVEGDLVRVTATLKSPLKIAGTITGFTANLPSQGTVTKLHMEKAPIEVAPLETLTFDLVGTYSGNPSFDPITAYGLTFVVYGVTVQVNNYGGVP